MSTFAHNRFFGQETKMKDLFNDLQPPVAISLDKLDPNEGQLQELGLPGNPRDIKDEKYELLKENIKKYPEFLRQNSLIVYPYANDRFIIIGGNMRYHALKELGFDSVPCSVLPVDTPIENLKAFIVLDNSSFGQWNWAKLQSSDWSAEELQDWGVECDFLSDDFFVSEEPDNGESIDDYKEPEKDYLECPHCHHVDSKTHFKKVSGKAESNDCITTEESNEDISIGD